MRVLCLVLLIVSTSSQLHNNRDNEDDNKPSNISLTIDIINWILSTFILLGIECYWLWKIIKTSESIIIRFVYYII